MVEFINCLEISDRILGIEKRYGFLVKRCRYKNSTQIKQDCFLKFHNFRSKM
jgi:hypothetical protein